MSLIYTRSDSIGRKIIPAPLISINKNYEINDDGTKRGTNYSITLTGTLLPFRGSPSGSYTSLSTAFHTIGGNPIDEINTGNNSDFNNILRKQEALRWLFSEDGGSLEWQPAGGQPPVKCFPKVLSIAFSEGQWTDRNEYTIELEAPWIYINGASGIEDNISTDLISTSTENWSFEETQGRDGKQYKVSHDVEAKGVLGYDGIGGLYQNKQAWEHAKTFVDTRISGSVSSNIMFSALGASGKINGNYNTVIRIDQDGGTYGITEDWLLSDTNTYEEKQFTVEYNQQQDEYSVTYDGIIYGVVSNSRNGSVDNVNIAKSAIPSISDARLIAITNIGTLIGSKSIPSFPDRQTFGLNQQDGTVRFTYQWNTSDNSLSFITEQGQHSFSFENLLNTLTLSQTVEGKGSSASEKLTNAKNGVYTDSAALIKAKTLAGTNLSYSLLSISKSFDEHAGIIKANWTWTDRDSNNTDITIQTQQATQTLAIIPIPGRASGPIVQNMGTKGSEIIIVTIRSKRNTIQPVLDTTIYGGGGTIIGDNFDWNPKTGAAQRTTRFLKET